MMSIEQVERFVKENSEGVSLSHFWRRATGGAKFSMSQSDVQRIIEACEAGES